MDKPEVQESSSAQPQKKCSACSAKASSEGAKGNESEKEKRKESCPLSYLPHIYVLGKVEVRFPNRSIEKEYGQIIERLKAAESTDKMTLYHVLSQPENRYLIRKLSWVLAIEGVPTYILIPTSLEDIDALLKAVLPSAYPLDKSVIIGRKGTVAPREMCGLEIPVVLIDHIFYLDHNTFIKFISSKSTSSEKFRAAIEEMFQRMMQIGDNMGTTDKHRALNYLAVRYSAIYTKGAEELERNFSLTSVDALLSRLSNNRKIVSVVFSFTNMETGIVEKYFVRVDTTEDYPFIVTEMSPYYDR